MTERPWVLLDTETNGVHEPIYAVEIGAQKMRAWLPDGLPFRRLLNHNASISPEASRVNGYTREILERDGDDPIDVYRDFAAYVGADPLVSYNLQFDLDRVLLPEWERLGLAPIGQRGFCALELARRLLDPVPAGNCKLQTLRQFYRLPERGAHTALGDVETVVDLLDKVLRPLAEARDLNAWEDLIAFTEEEWFPSIIGFGKFKGRNFREALTDPELMGWLEWLSNANTERSARMGCWYLMQLEEQPAQHVIDSPGTEADASLTIERGIVLYLSPQRTELQRLIAAARERLADLEAEYTAEKCAVEVTLARLFQALRPQYQHRDQLKLRVEYQRRYLDALLQSGDEEAEEVQEAHRKASQATDEEYEEAAAEAAEKKALTEDQTREIQTIWRKLVRMFHPDRCMDDPEKRQAHEWLTSEINQARERGDIELLREIARDPNAFLLKHGQVVLSQESSEDVARLRTLFDALQQRILETLEALNSLHETPGYELHQRGQEDETFFENAVTEHRTALEVEIDGLKEEAAGLAEEIEGLTGETM